MIALIIVLNAVNGLSTGTAHTKFLPSRPQRRVATI